MRTWEACFFSSPCFSSHARESRRSWLFRAVSDCAECFFSPCLVFSLRVLKSTERDHSGRSKTVLLGLWSSAQALTFYRTLLAAFFAAKRGTTCGGRAVYVWVLWVKLGMP